MHQEVQGAAISAITTCRSHRVCCCFLSLVIAICRVHLLTSRTSRCCRHCYRHMSLPPTASLLSSHVTATKCVTTSLHYHCHVQGAPFNIKDFKVLLDAQVYEDLEGRWVDLFNRMKWDIVKSVLKSVAGLQGRKFKVLPLPLPSPCGPQNLPLFSPCARSVSH